LLMAGGLWLVVDGANWVMKSTELFVSALRTKRHHQLQHVARANILRA